MNTLHTYQAIEDLARDNAYKLFMTDTSTNLFLGYDNILDEFCIVKYKIKNGEYLLDIDTKPTCFSTKDEANREFNRIVVRNIL